MAFRTNATGAITDGATGRKLFRDRDVAGGIPHGTAHLAVDRTMAQEEILGLVEGLGIGANASVAVQALQALRRAAALNVTSVTAGATLTADHVGLVLVAASSAGYTITLPAANALAPALSSGLSGAPAVGFNPTSGGALPSTTNAQVARLIFVRTDATAYAVTLAAAGTDTADGAASITLPAGGMVALVSNGQGQWLSDRQAAQQQSASYAADSGTANAMVAALSPAPRSLAAMTGAAVRLLKGGSANTGAVTLNLNGLGAQPVRLPDGSAFTGGELPANGMLQVAWNGSAFVLLSAPSLTQNLAVNGWVKLPNGLIIQWGGLSGTTGSLSGAGVAEAVISASYPISFPVGAIAVYASASDVSGGGLQETASATLVNSSVFSALLSCRQAGTGMTGFFLAIGK